MGKSLIIIGKGYSVTRCTKAFVDSHDEVCIINSPVYGGYEHLLSDHADYLFTNKTGIIYPPQFLEKLGLKEMFFTGQLTQRFESQSPKVKSTYPSPNLHDKIMATDNFTASSGMQALTYFIESKNYSKISIVGFDFYEVGTPPYYFNVNEAQPQVKSLWNNDWKNNTINVASLHSESESIDYMIKLIKENSSVEFEMISDNKRVNLIEINNCKIK